MKQTVSKDTVASYTIEGEPTSNGTETAASQISTISLDVPRSAEQLKIGDANLSRPDTEAGKAETEGVLEDIRTVLEANVCQNASFDVFGKITVEGTDLAYRIPFSCPIHGSGSDKGFGYYIYAADQQRSYDIIIMSEQKTWDKYQSTWDDISKNIKISAL